MVSIEIDQLNRLVNCSQLMNGEFKIFFIIIAINLARSVRFFPKAKTGLRQINQPFVCCFSNIPSNYFLLRLLPSIA